MNPRLKETLLALIFGGLLGGTLGWLLEELTWSRLSESRLLTAIVYGPLPNFEDGDRQVQLNAASYALLFATVWQSMRSHRWLPLATVLVAGLLFNVLTAIIDTSEFDSFLTIRSLNNDIPVRDLRGVVHTSPEGTLFLSLVAFAWYALLIVCLARGWQRWASSPVPAMAASEAPASASAASRKSFAFGTALLDAAAPIAAGLFVGYIIGNRLDAWTIHANFSNAPSHRVDQIVRLVVAGPVALLRFEEQRTALVLAPLFAVVAFLLWKAADGLRWRRLARVVYLSLVTVQLGLIVCYSAAVGFDSFVDFELAGLGQVIVKNVYDAAFLATTLAACHAYAVWCLFRYRGVNVEREE